MQHYLNNHFRISKFIYQYLMFNYVLLNRYWKKSSIFTITTFTLTVLNNVHFVFIYNLFNIFLAFKVFHYCNFTLNCPILAVVLLAFSWRINKSIIVEMELSLKKNMRRFITFGKTTEKCPTVNVLNYI